MKRQERLLRSWALAGFSTTLAALSHSLAGGQAPHLITWFLATSLAALLCLGLTYLKINRIALATSVALSQSAFHLLYQGGDGVVLAGAEHQHHHHQLVLIAESGHQGAHGGSMLALHTLAALATYLLIRRFEETLAALKDLASKTWHRLIHLSTPRPLPAPIKLSPVSHPASYFSSILTSCIRRRGPPFAPAHQL